MKLTKAQRLFIKAGIEMGEYAYWKWVDTCDNCDVLDEIVEHRKKYKKHIREALRAYELEIGDAFSAGRYIRKRLHGKGGISENAPMVIEDNDQTIIF